MSIEYTTLSSDYETINLFPTTIHYANVQDFNRHKESFYKIYHKYDYEEDHNQTTVSENIGKPFLHLEDDLDDLFKVIIDNVRTYVHQTLNFKDIFNFCITKTWLSKATSTKLCLPYHMHSTSHISFVYYISCPENSSSLVFENPHRINSLFLGSTSQYNDDKFDLIDAVTKTNANSYYIKPHEGALILFPSNLEHCTRNSTDAEMKGERIAISGDITLILKEEYTNLSCGYIDNKYWSLYT